MQLFNPPPLASMNLRQKVGRILFISLTLITVCILAAIALAAVIFVVEQSSLKISATPEWPIGLAIVFTSICVNTLCVIALLEIKKLDSKFNLPPQAAS